MEPNLSNSLALLDSISEQQLYDNLIRQLNKDFMLAGIRHEFKPDIMVTQLVTSLRDKIQELISDHFNDLLNLLYVVDLSEMEVKNLSTGEQGASADEITYLLLRRLWKKVWLKHKLS